MHAHKLAKFIVEHGVKVTAVCEDSISVESPVCDTKTGNWVFERAEVAANLDAVKAFLGY